MIESLLEYRFLQNALFAGLMASVVCGIIGVVVIEKKLVMMSGGIAHTAYGGIGLGYLMGFEPMIGAFAFSMIAAFGMGYVNRRGDKRPEILIGLFWSLGMALGILFIAVMPGYPPDITSYLFGNILSVTAGELYLMAALTLIIAAVTVVFFNNWKAYLFDGEFAFITGVSSAFFEYLLLALIAMTAVVLIRVVGIILTLALLTAPAASSGLLSSSLKNRMILSVVLGMLFCLAGLWISYSTDAASGAVIVIISAIFYFAVRFSRALCAKYRKRTISGGEKAAGGLNGTEGS